MMISSVEDFIAMAGKAQPDERFRVRGTATSFFGPHMFFVQDASGGVLVWRSDAVQALRINDVVEITGIAAKTGVTPHLIATGLWVPGPGKRPAPLDLDPNQPPAADCDARLVRIRTRVAETNASQPEGRQVLLDAFGSTLAVIFEGPDETTRWPKLGPGDLVEVTGVLSIRKGEGTTYRVIAPRRTNLIQISTAPAGGDNPAALLAACGGLVAVGGLLVWNAARRRRRRVVVNAPAPALPRPEPTQSVKEIERRYHELFENATDVVLTHDLEGRITTFNPAGERLLGWKAEELIGQTIYSIMAPAEAEIAGGLVRSNRPADTPWGASFRLELKARDGRVLPFEVNSWVEFKAGEPVGVQAICRNISQRLRSEGERARFERRLQETQKLESLGILAGGIAHDFNNLLTAILGNASLARIELGPESPASKSLEEIEIAAERASDLCSQMLAYSGQGRFVVTRVELSALVTETLSFSKPRSANARRWNCTWPKSCRQCMAIRPNSDRC